MCLKMFGTTEVRNTKGKGDDFAPGKRTGSLDMSHTHTHTHKTQTCYSCIKRINVVH
jgi:hypothetical protein